MNKKQKFARKVKFLIVQFFINQEILRSSMEITDVVVRNKRKVILITITLVRPAILIGIHGTVIDGLTEYLNKILEKPVQINIEESKIWR